MSSVCNQLPMIAVNLKKTDNVSFDKPLTNYIKSEFDAKTSEAHKPLVQELTQIREELRFCDRLEKNEATRQRILRYLKYVNSLDSRFPVSESNIRIQFYWYDAYNAKRTNQYSMTLEKAGWVFQLGALESQIAAATDRRTDEGLKTSCRYFSMAAGTFAYLRDLVQSKPSVMGTGDLTPEFCTMIETLMLAQAQECFFVKAEVANMKPGVLSKLAAECSNLYARAFGIVANPGRHSTDKAWLPHLQIRHAMYQGLANYYVGVDLGQAEKYGEQVAYLTKSIQYLTSPNLQKALSLSPPILVAEFNNRVNIVGSAHRIAANDNAKIYHERVPSELPPIEGKIMVKNVEFQDQIFSADQDPFGRLIPVAVTAALTSYNERKTQIVTLLLKKIEEANAAAKANLNSMGLPGSILALEGGGLPKEILDRVRDFKQNGGISSILESIQRRNDMANRCEQLLQEAEGILDQEEADESALTNQYRGRWNRTPSHHLTVAQRQEILRHKGNLTHAKKSDAIVQKKLETHLTTLTALSGSDAEAQSLLPRGASSSMTNHPSVVKLKQLLKQLDDVLAERETIDTNVKSTRDKDDITQALLSSPMIETTVTSELSKYDSFQQSIQANIIRQNEIVQATATANGEFIAAKGSEGAGSQREAIFQQIGNALSLAFELRNNLKEGIQFYTDFQTVLSKLKSYCDSFSVARCAEKEEIISNLRLDVSVQQQQQQQQQYQPQFQFTNPYAAPPPSSSSSIPPQQPSQYFVPPQGPPQGLPPGFTFQMPPGRQ